MTDVRVTPAQRRAAYRRWIRDHHPDVGGDPESFVMGLARYRAALRRDRHPGGFRRYDAPVVFVSNSERRRRRLRRLWRQLRRHAPTRVR